jgi:bacterioferritin (cytochrome b1)
MSNNNDSSTPPPQYRESGNMNNGGINNKKILQDLKADQEQFYSRISKIAQSEIAASPPYNKQFEKILQNSAKRIAEIERELKKLEEKQGDQKQA